MMFQYDRQRDLDYDKALEAQERREHMTDVFQRVADKITDAYNEIDEARQQLDSLNVDEKMYYSKRDEARERLQKAQRRYNMLLQDAKRIGAGRADPRAPLAGDLRGKR